MEEDLGSLIGKAFSLGERDIRSYSPLTLAFLGDAVFEIVVRTLIVKKENVPPSVLHAHSAHFVKAGSQAKIYDAILPVLTEEEADILRRGRNAHSPTHAKNATVLDYRKATGFEALLGFLYLKGETDRIIELSRYGILEGLEEKVEGREACPEKYEDKQDEVKR